MFRKTVSNHLIFVSRNKVTIYRREGKKTVKIGDYPLNYDFSKLNVPNEVKNCIQDLVNEMIKKLRSEEERKKKVKPVHKVEEKEKIIERKIEEEKKININEVLSIVNSIVEDYDKFIKLLIDYNHSIIEFKISKILENEINKKNVVTELDIENLRKKISKTLSLEYSKLKEVLITFSSLYNINQDLNNFYSILAIKDVPIEKENIMNITIKLPSLTKMHQWIKEKIIQPKIEKIKQLIQQI